MRLKVNIDLTLSSMMEVRTSKPCVRVAVVARRRNGTVIYHLIRLLCLYYS